MYTHSYLHLCGTIIITTMHDTPCVSPPLHIPTHPTYPHLSQQFLPVAQDLEQNNWTRFTPHYKIWRCPDSYKDSDECRKQCIHKGRYCSPDPESEKFDGKDVVEENLRQLCVFKLANASGQSWLWWDYATRFADQCAMDTAKYGKECAEQVWWCVCGGGGVHDVRVLVQHHSCMIITRASW